MIGLVITCVLALFSSKGRVGLFLFWFAILVLFMLRFGIVGEFIFYSIAAFGYTKMKGR